MSNESEPNLLYWDAMRTPPEDALKKISGGRLSGMTDISPQWRYEVMTCVFGPCGIGWKYEIDSFEMVPGADDQVVVFAHVRLYVRDPGGEWSDPIPGTGGSMFIAAENRRRSGPVGRGNAPTDEPLYTLYTSDEAKKMALTDALSVAMKMLGVGADVYRGHMDTKYSAPAAQGAARQAPAQRQAPPTFPAPAAPAPKPRLAYPETQKNPKFCPMGKHQSQPWASMPTADLTAALEYAKGTGEYAHLITDEHRMEIESIIAARNTAAAEPPNTQPEEAQDEQ
jgi:hypothetical protein